MTQDERIQATVAAVNAEMEFRNRNPGCGAALYAEVYRNAVEINGQTEVGFVAFERTGMNLIESGKITFVLTGDAVTFGTVRDFCSRPVPGREAYFPRSEPRCI